ncbi:RNA-binding protein 26 [Lingula anatina]|uniref:RNA-binding protein 26 n=1 Tax=Lingula anatina TaxID=7574 RepID=A0A1S3HK14_LINAN|nr:RNA-binding protein 26 [Lingula anatina]|eukprot:XP_013385334.1 RNA-binding protein 26 [Lingula anatina]
MTLLSTFPKLTVAVAVAVAQDVIKKRLEIQKQKQTLLQKQLEQQKLLIQKLDKNKGTSPEEKAVIVKTIKTLAASIDKLKLEITASPNVGGTTGGGGVEFHHKSKQEAQKELLDTELELMTKETSGGDTSDLRKKIMELKREAAALGIVEARRGRGRGRGGAAPRGRGRGRGRGGVTMAARSVDRRPRQLLVRGFSLNEKDEVISQFQNYGEIEKIDCDESEPNVILTFKTRQEAETAAREGQKFKEKSLSMSWYQQKSPEKGQESGEGVMVTRATARRTSITANLPGEGGEEEEGEESTNAPVVVPEGEEEDEEELDELDEDILLGADDEEDDDDEEDKSWRR